MDKEKRKEVLNEVHPELGSLVEDFENRIRSYGTSALQEEFQHIESQMWEDLGIHNGDHSCWLITITPGDTDTARQRAEELRNSGVKVRLVGAEDGVKSSGFLAVEQLVVGGDPYAMLTDPRMFLTMCSDDHVGLIVRTNGWASATAAESGDVRPSEADDKFSVMTTVMISNLGIWCLVRNADTGEVLVMESKSTEDIFSAVETSRDDVTGMGRLADQVVATYHGPHLIKANKPHIYEEMVERATRMAEDQGK